MSHGHSNNFSSFASFDAKVLNKRIVHVVLVYHIIKADGIFYGVQLSPAHAEFHDINELIFYSALFKIALGLFVSKHLLLPKI